MPYFTLQTSSLAPQESLDKLESQIKDRNISEDQKISSVTMVGALCLDAEKDFDNEGLIDAYRLRHFVKYCCEHLVPLRATLNVDIINLKDDRDFLSEDQVYDAVLICYVPLKAEDRSKAVIRAVHPSFFTTSSRLNAVNTPEEVWLNRLKQAAKKMCVSFSATGKEVDVASLFSDDSFHCIKPSCNPQARMMTLLNEVHVNRLPENSGLTPNYGNFFRFLKPDEQRSLIEMQMSMQMEINYKEALEPKSPLNDRHQAVAFGNA